MNFCTRLSLRAESFLTLCQTADRQPSSPLCSTQQHVLRQSSAASFLYHVETLSSSFWGQIISSCAITTNRKPPHELYFSCFVSSWDANKVKLQSDRHFLFKSIWQVQSIATFLLVKCSLNTIHF